MIINLNNICTHSPVIHVHSVVNTVCIVDIVYVSIYIDASKDKVNEELELEILVQYISTLFQCQRKTF